MQFNLTFLPRFEDELSYHQHEQERYRAQAEEERQQIEAGRRTRRSKQEVARMMRRNARMDRRSPQTIASAFTSGCASTETNRTRRQSPPMMNSTTVSLYAVQCRGIVTTLYSRHLHNYGLFHPHSLIDLMQPGGHLITKVNEPEAEHYGYRYHPIEKGALPPTVSSSSSLTSFY